MRANSVRLTTIGTLFLLGVSCTPDYNLTDGAPDVDPGLVTECDFIPVQGTQLSEYACNPVFAGTDEGWSGDIKGVGFHVTEVLGHPFYQAWYTADNGSGSYGLGYAVSNNGTDWESHPDNPLLEPGPSDWDRDSMAAQVVVYDDDFNEYLMAYQGITFGQSDFDAGSWGMGIATSKDGVDWTKHASNPVIDFVNSDPSAPTSPCWPLTINKTDAGYVGWMAATVNDPFGALFGIEYPCEIYSMTSLDRVNWSISPQPVIPAPSSGPDSMGVTSASVVEFNGSLHMFYIGFSSWTTFDTYRSATNTSLLHAVSLDNGATWIRDGAPLTTGRNAPGQISGVAAQAVGSRILLWLTDEYPDLGSTGVGYYYYEPDIDAH